MAQVSEEQVKRAATEFLSHKGERPWRVTRRGAELWEDYAPAMRAALEAALSLGQAGVGVAGDDAELVERLRHLVRLNEPKHGGPYQGYAAAECVKAMTEAANRIEALTRELAEARAERDELDFLYHEGGTMEEQLSKAEARAERAEALASGVSVDDAMVEAVMLSMFGALNEQTNYHCWIPQERKQATEVVRTALKAALSSRSALVPSPQGEGLVKPPEDGWEQSADAMVWAKAYLYHVQKNNLSFADAVDPGYMVGWFANYWAAITRDRLPASALARAGEEDGWRDAASFALRALRDAQEELRLIRMKDCGAVYDPVLRAATLPLAIQKIQAVLAASPTPPAGREG